MTRAGTLGAPGAHLDDGALLRHLDGELEPAEAGNVEAHLAACARCRAELDAIAAAANRVAASLRLIDFAPEVDGSQTGVARRTASPAWHSSPIWRAAAAIALVAGLALAIAPVRAWIAERFGLAADRTADGVSRVTRMRPQPVRPRAPASGSPSSRRATGSESSSRPRRQKARSISRPPPATRRAARSWARTTPISSSCPDGLGIRNQPFSTADYRVAVPRHMAAVEVEVAGRAEWRGSPEDLPADGIRIELSEGLDRSSDP